MAEPMSATGAAGQPYSTSSMMVQENQQNPITVSVVIPVYKGERTLSPLVEELARFVDPTTTSGGREFRIAEVVLVHDGAVDDSRRVMDELAARYGFVRLVWLSRNFGQHAATLAGAASTTSEWVVTMDEDGDHDPAAIAQFLDTASEQRAQVVYGRPMNVASHGFLRNALSLFTKQVVVRVLVGDPEFANFHSYRLIHGEIARSLAAFCGYKIYLDVAISWVVARIAHCPITLRNPQGRRSGYDYRRLSSHFWRLVLTSGTRPLRIVSLVGAVAFLLALVLTGKVLWDYFTGNIPVQGYTSLIIAMSLFSGAILFSLGVVAEYLGAALGVSMGRPLYLVVTRPFVDAEASTNR
jgi:undecaprenyl-phosphate 4-deoxy-4-formamido-L-arabinose transferase